MNKQLWWTLVILFGTTLASRADPELPNPVSGLVARVIPQYQDKFSLQTIDRDPAGDVFELESQGGKIVIRGNNGVAQASGLNWYLKHYCHAHLSWCGDQLNLPDPLPAIPEKIRQVSPFRYRYCFNYCAFSYSLAWWDWPEWERMIDWMALHGINMPLAVTGQEATWREVYRKLGLTEQQIAGFFVGPAFLPFGWMGCLDGWGGPLPESWITRRAALQQKILARERELGMTPVLQGFTGHVPGALTNVFPEAKLQRLPKWCEFPSTCFVDPKDPLFLKIGKLFIEEQRRQFGTDHLYASDTFIEMQPPSNEPAFLADMGKTVYEAMRAGDPDAVWVLQGWLFVNNPTFWQPPQARALLGSVPDDRLIVLDLFCESTPAWSKTEAFHGKPWIWCIIQNFGGTVSLHGGLPQIAGDLSKALTSPTRGRLSGIGLIFEGLDYNPIVQDFVTDMTWRTDVPELKAWMDAFVKRRYGRSFPETDAAWRILRETVYREPGRSDTGLCSRPGTNSLGTGSGAYAPATLFEVSEKLLARKNELGRLDTYQFDLVNITRQALGTLAGGFHQSVMTAVARQDAAGLDIAGQRLLALCEDLDDLLSTRREFLLGRWLHDAERWGASSDDAKLYQFNARNLITLWGPMDSPLHEYAARQWSGMFKGFYALRWQLFLTQQKAALSEKRPFDAAQFEHDVRVWEEKWNRQTDSYPDQPHGNAIEVAQRLLAKYKPVLQEGAAPNPR